MNHFEEETLGRIAAACGLELIGVHTQIRRHDYEPLPRGFVSNAAKWVANRAYAITGEPGHTMIGFFRKS